MHEKSSKALGSAYIPLLLLRNQLISVFIVSFSFNPNIQLVSIGSIIVVYTIYSLVFCPYRPVLRVIIHISQVIYVLQIVFMYIQSISQGDYGAQYDIGILDVGLSMYKSALIVLGLNCLQMILSAILSLLLIAGLVNNRLCKTKKKKLAVQNDYNYKNDGVDPNFKINNSSTFYCNKSLNQNSSTFRNGTKKGTEAVDEQTIQQIAKF